MDGVFGAHLKWIDANEEVWLLRTSPHGPTRDAASGTNPNLFLLKHRYKETALMKTYWI